MVCRLIEGNYPNYNAVIPTNNPNKVLVDRIELLNAIRRVAVLKLPMNLIRLDVKEVRLSCRPKISTSRYRQTSTSAVAMMATRLLSVSNRHSWLRSSTISQHRAYLLSWATQLVRGYSSQ